MAGDIHVVPVNDPVAHIEERDCWCAPRVESAGYPITAVIIHNWADGRQETESDDAMLARTVAAAAAAHRRFCH